MAEFMIRFFLCNVIISGIIGILLIVKRLLRHTLSSRLQYNLWFLLLIFLLLPFVPSGQCLEISVLEHRFHHFLLCRSRRYGERRNYLSRRRFRLDERFCTLRHRKGTFFSWLSTVWNIDDRYCSNDAAGHLFFSPPAPPEKLCPAASEPGSPQALPALSKKNAYTKIHSHLQYNIFKITDDDRSHKATHLSSDSSHFRL